MKRPCEKILLGERLMGTDRGGKRPSTTPKVFKLSKNRVLVPKIVAHTLSTVSNLEKMVEKITIPVKDFSKLSHTVQNYSA